MIASSEISCAQPSGQRIRLETAAYKPGAGVGLELSERSTVALWSRPCPCRCWRCCVLSAVESSAQAQLKSAQPRRSGTSFPFLERRDWRPYRIPLIESSDGTNCETPWRPERKTHSCI